MADVQTLRQEEYCNHLLHVPEVMYDNMTLKKVYIR
jgi:hypothetical protein